MKAARCQKSSDVAGRLLMSPYTTLAQNDEYAKVCGRELSTSPAIPLPHIGIGGCHQRFRLEY